MKIGFDIDGVLADFNSSFIKLIPEVTGRNLFPAGYWPDTWNYPESVGYTKEEVSAVWEVIKAGGTFWEGLAPLPDVATLNMWLCGSCDEFPALYFITSRMGRNVKYQTEQWCVEHLGLPNATVLISSAKGAIAKSLSLDYYVDDRAENIADVVVQSPQTNAFLLHQPWNTHMQMGHRILGLSEFLRAIDRTSDLLPSAA